MLYMGARVSNLSGDSEWCVNADPDNGGQLSAPSQPSAHSPFWSWSINLLVVVVISLLVVVVVNLLGLVNLLSADAIVTLACILYISMSIRNV